MKNFHIVFVLLVAAFIASSCSHTNEQLLRAEQLVESSPDSAMAILNKYSYNKLSDKDKALYGLLYIRLRDKKFLPLEPDSLLNFSLNYYYDKPEGDYLSMTLLYVGRKYKYNLMYDKATEYYVKAFDNVQNTDNYLLQARLNLDLADIHYNQKDFVQARSKYWKSFVYFKKAGLQPQAFYALLNIGRTYHYSNEFAKAGKYYLKIKPYAKDSLQAGSLLHETGQNFYKSKRYDSAYLYLSRVIHYPYIGNNQSLRYYHLADLLFDMNKIDSAFFYAKKSLDGNIDLRTRKGCYRIIVNCKTLKGDINALNHYMSKYQECDDSIRKIDLQTKGSYIETMHYTQKQVVKSRSWIWYLSLLFIIFAAGGIYLYIRKHKKSEKVIEQSKADYNREKAELRKDIMLKKRETLFANIDRIKEEQKKPENRTLNFTLRVKNMYNELLHIQDSKLFFCEMDGVLNNIATKLREVLPEISDKELTYCCLHLLNLPTHDILILLDYESANSLKGMKRRLAQKLSIQNATLLNDFLLNLLSND